MDILKALNIDEVTDPPPLTTTATTGESVTITDPSSWHPLKRDYTVFNPTAQVLQVGIPFSQAYSALWGDGGTGYLSATPFPGTGTSSWASGCTKRSVTADIDGDGIDEWLVFYTPTNGGTIVNFTIGRHTAATSVAFSAPQEITGFIASSYLSSQYERTAFPVAGVWRNTRYPYFQLSAADIDGDGAQEILMANYSTAVILKCNGDDTITTVDSKTFTAAVSSFKGGDVDGDRKAELAVCVQGQGFALYDSSFSSPITNPEFMTSGWSGFSWSDVVGQGAFGDFDGDNIDEIAIKVTGTMGWITKTYKVHNRAIDEMNTITNVDTFPATMTNIATPPIAIDIDGDGVDELFLSPFVCHSVLTSPNTSIEKGSLFPNVDYIIDMGVGDVDGDGKKDLVHYYYINSDGTTNGTISARIAALGITPGGQWNNLEIKKVFIDKVDIGVGTEGSKTCIFSICMTVGHGFDNSPRVQYIGHELQFTDPIVIAVLASPPYYADIAEADPSYAYNSWVTTFGRKTSEAASSTTKIGFSIGASLEYEGGASIFGLKIATFKASASFENAMSWEWTTSNSITKSITYTCNGGEDRVVFTAVPLDSYSYRVLTSTNASDIGRLLHINLPRNYATYTVTRSFFNDHNGDLADIGSNVLPHTLGQVRTYPSVGLKNSLMDTYGGYFFDAQPVGQSSVSNNGTALEIEVERGNERSFSIDQERRFSVGAGAGGFVASIEAGFNVGYTYTSSTSEGTSFGGTVGYLPSAYYNNPLYRYSSGLFVYPYNDPNSLQTYWVVNYWIE